MSKAETTQVSDAQEEYAHRAYRMLVWAEDAVYSVTAVVLGLSALVVLCKGVYDLLTKSPDGVIKAIETSFEALLIVFILVELMTAVRVAVTEHELVGEPFLLVGILAAIKELVALSTFKIDEGKASDVALKVGVLAGVILVLAASTWILRRREREPEEAEEEGPPSGE